MDVEAFNQRVNELTQNISQGFIQAYNSTKVMQDRKDASHSVQSVSELDDHRIKVTATFRGNKADLFARTFDSILRYTEHADVGRRNAIKPLKGAQPDVGEEKSDRELPYAVWERDAETFLKQMGSASRMVEHKKRELARLYQIGMSAEHEIGIGRPEVASKFYVFLQEPPEPGPYDLAPKRHYPDLLLKIITNNPILIDEAVKLAPLKNSPIEINSVGEFDVNQRERKYKDGVELVARNLVGNELLAKAVRRAGKQRNLGSHTGNIDPPGPGWAIT